MVRKNKSIPHKLKDKMPEVIKAMKEFQDHIVAKRFGVCKESIRRHRKNLKIGKPRQIIRCQTKIITEETFSQALKMKKQGIAWSEVARKLNLSERYIRHFFYVKGYRWEDFPRERIIRKKEKFEQAIKLLNKGWNYTEISKKLNIQSQTVSIWDKKYRKANARQEENKWRQEARKKDR